MLAPNQCRRCTHLDSDHVGGRCLICKINGFKCYRFRGAPASRVNRVSKRRVGVNRRRAQAQLEAWGPRPWRCKFSDFVANNNRHYPLFEDRPLVVLPANVMKCLGEVNGHEIHSRGRNGTDENLIDVRGQVPLCNHHNEWCASNSDLAEKIGLSI